MTEREIFLAARDAPTAAAQAAVLDQSCGANVDLRRHVAALLAEHEQLGSYLETPAAQRPVDEPQVAERPGTLIGPYKLMEQIGEGGMGLVFVAEQQRPVRRKVAVKVIKPGMDTREVIARFEAERQALALMDHANIARVFDAGATESGRPYFVMELVRGVGITQFCDENRLTPRERLELFVHVCQAVQHAHHKGVIHRDLKSTNILVTLHDGTPVVKVIDFGVAKAIGQQLTDKTIYTRFAQMIGTPMYMSPEQAEMSGLDIDTRSDIYALGVLLYELLTGTTPFDNERLRTVGYDELRRIIREEEPPRPSTRLSDSGETLASISANRHTEPAKLTKLVKGELDWIVLKALEKDRNRRYETASAFAADVQRYLHDEPVLACPPSAMYRLRKFARRNKAALAFTGLVLLILLSVTGGIGWNLRDRAMRETAVELQANLALNEAEQWQERARWPEALSAVQRTEGLLVGGGSDELRERVRQLRKDLELVLRLEEIRLLASEIKENAFDWGSADQAYRQAFDAYGINVLGLPVEEAAARIRARTGVVVSLVVALDNWQHVRDGADHAGPSRLTELAQAADPDPWRRQVRQAVEHKDRKTLAALAASPELLRQPPTSLVFLSNALRFRGLAQAEIAVLRQAQRQYPGDFWVNFSLAWTLQRRGPSFSDDTVSFYRAALAVRPQCNAAYVNLGLALINQGKLDEAIAWLRKAIDLDPKSGAAHNNLGQALSKQGYLDGAIASYRTAIDHDPKNARYHHNLGTALKQLGKLDEAIAWLKKAVALDPNFAEAHTNLGNALRERGKLDEAIACYRTAIGLAPKLALAHGGLGQALFIQKKWNEVITCYRTAIEIDPKNVDVHYSLGLAFGHQDKLNEAIGAFRTAIELDPKHTEAHYSLGIALKDQEKLAEAVAAFRTALALNPKHTGAHCYLGEALRAQKKLTEAIAAFRTALALDPKYTRAHYSLGALYCDYLQEYDKALACFTRAIELEPDFAEAWNCRGVAHRALKQYDQAIANYSKAIELRPDYANAWRFRHEAYGSLKRYDRAVAAYLAATDLKPDNAVAWYYRGLAHYGSGDWKTALTALQKSMELRNGGNSFDWFFVAMAHWQLGNKDEARQWYNRAVAWMDKQQPQNAQLRLHRVEAAGLLGVKEKQK